MEHDIVSFMDFMCVNESSVDKTLENIFTRTTFTKEHLNRVTLCLRYKLLLNEYDGNSTDNKDEVEFALRLISLEDQSLQEQTCDIVQLAILLNKDTLEINAQHILQQLFCDLDITSISKINEIETNKLMFKINVLDSVLMSAITTKIKIFLLFSEIPLEHVIYYNNPNVCNHFITKTVHLLIEAVEGFKILDRIWDSVSSSDVTLQKKALVSLSALSEYYLPMLDNNGIFRFKSAIVHKQKFWIKLLEGLKSDDEFDRRCALYLAKRAIDYISTDKKDIEVKKPGSNEMLFVWKADSGSILTAAWKNFFILLETLEEKQSNIVQAGLALFNEIALVCKCWRDCAFDLALKHPNLIISQRSIVYKIKDGVNCIEDGIQLLQAVNNINLYDASQESLQTIAVLNNLFTVSCQFQYILKVFSEVRWLPVPLFRLTELFVTSKVTTLKDEHAIWNIIQQITSIPCNNVIISAAVHCNVVNYILENRCMSIQLFLKYISKTPYHYEINTKIMKQIIEWIDESVNTNEDLNIEFLDYIMQNMFSVDIILAYINYKPKISIYFFNKIEECIKIISDVNDRPYSNHLECKDQFIYICKLIKKIMVSKNLIAPTIVIKTSELVENYTESLLRYIISSSTQISTLDHLVTYLKYCPSIFELMNSEKLQSEFLKYPCLELSDKNVIDIINAVCHLHSSPVIIFKIQILVRTSNILDLIKKQNDKQNNARVGIVKNQMYKLCSEIVFDILSIKSAGLVPLDNLSQFLYHILDTGNEECLLWALKIYKIILPDICANNASELDPEIFLTRSWQDVKDIRSNALGRPSMKEYIGILLDPALLSKDNYHELIKIYSIKILDYSAVTNVPLYYLTKEMYSVDDVCQYPPVALILSDILLFGRNTSKDQRITDVTVKYIKENQDKFSVLDKSKCDHYFDSEIRNMATKLILQSATPEVITVITSTISKRVLTVFRNKTRYHGNSEAHRLLFRTLQHTLLFIVMCPDVDFEYTVLNYTGLLAKLPHELSVRLCIEILMAYYIIIKRSLIEKSVIENLSNVPLTSLFMTLYLVIKHKLKYDDTPAIRSEYNIVMDLLLTHTMGQVFNVRLHAQYFALKLHEIAVNVNNYEFTTKYDGIIAIIKHTFNESKTEKNLIKLQNNYFINDFDVVENLTPKCIYNVIPKLTEIDFDEIIEESDILSIEDCKLFMKKSGSTNIWENRNIEEPQLKETCLKNVCADTKESDLIDVSTIQKKYIPWNRMFHGEEACIINVKKDVKESGLILVASLIDKLPNLGGLARTSEVFGIKKYVINNLKHLEDKNFQGLSVSAEKWIDIEQVKPGNELKQFIERMRNEGYTIIAAEQTSNSEPLQNFRFPHNTLLLLGHEKEGVPCDLLPYMDHCVEVPQRGCVRSLNVHVTAAIFVWEYVRQNLL